MKQKGVVLLSNKALEENIKSLSADYIYEQAVGSFLLLLLSAMEDAEKGVTALPCEIPQDIQEIKSAILEHLFRLEELLADDAQRRVAALEDCMALKKRLLSIYETVYSYFSQWNIISALVSDQVDLRKYKKDGIDAKQVDWSLFFSDCRAFMEGAETLLKQKEYIGQLLKCIPLKMAREKFYDTVRTSLEAAFAGDSKELIETSLKTFEGFCSPQSNPLYGKYFGEIAEKIGQKQMLLPHQLSDEALDEVFEELKEIYEKLKDIEEYFSCILHDLNSLILLFYLTYSFEDLTERNVTYADLYHTVRSFLNGEMPLTEKAAYLDTLNEQLEAAVEPVIDKANVIGRKEYDLLQKAGSFADFSEDTKKILMTEEFIRDCFFGDLNDELFRFDLPENLPPATEAEKRELFEDFIEKTRNTFETLPAQTRKIAMQNLAGALPPLYTVQEAMELIINAIHTSTSEEQKILILDKVGMVLDEHGYQSVTDTEDMDEFIEHHHDCGCHHDHHHTHHHNHHHDCGCGHDHHDHHH